MKKDGFTGRVRFLWGADAHIGTWKLNPAKTKVTGPGPTYQTGTATFEAQENGFKLTYDQVTADGKTNHGEFTAKYDGNDYPVKGDPDTDAVSMRRINDRKVDYIYKKAGKEVMREHDVISSDGKTATVTFKGKNPKGADSRSSSFPMYSRAIPKEWPASSARPRSWHR